MNKKDIIALVISTIYSIFCIFIFITEGLPEFVILFMPVIFYWEYRRLKDDISFFKKK